MDKGNFIDRNRNYEKHAKPEQNICEKNIKQKNKNTSNNDSDTVLDNGNDFSRFQRDKTTTDSLEPNINQW